jgi:hypothetical protein
MCPVQLDGFRKKGIAVFRMGCWWQKLGEGVQNGESGVAAG